MKKLLANVGVRVGLRKTFARKQRKIERKKQTTDIIDTGKVLILLSAETRPIL